MRIPRAGVFLFAILSLAALLSAQPPSRRPLTHADGDLWRSVRASTFSPCGGWAAMVLAPAVGEGCLLVVSSDGSRTWEIPRGSGPAFSPDGRYLACRIDAPARAPGAASRPGPAPAPGGQRPFGRRGRGGEPPRPESGPAGPASAAGVPAELGLLELATGALRTVPGLKSFQMAREGAALLAYHLVPPRADSRPAASGPASRPAPGASQPAAPGGASPLVLLDLATGKETRLERVASFGLTRKRNLLHFTVPRGAGTSALPSGLHLLDPATGCTRTLLAGECRIESVVLDREERRIAFLSDRATAKERRPVLELYGWEEGTQAARLLVSPAATPGFPAGRTLGGSLAFSRDGSALLLSAESVPAPTPPAPPADERVLLDLWNWRDGLLQSMQAKRSPGEGRDTRHGVYHLAEGRFVLAGDEELPRIRFITRDGTRAVASTGKPYEALISWDGAYQDLFLINTLDGSRRLALKGLRGNATNSPGGRYLVYFGADSHWHSLDVLTLQDRALTAGLQAAFADEEWDKPEPAPAYGLAGWTEGDREVLLYDRCDLWRVAADGSGAACVTGGLGRASGVQLRLVRLDSEEEHVPAGKRLLFSALDLETCATGFYAGELSGLERPRRLIMREARFGSPVKAKAAERLFFSLSSFRDFPDLWTADMEFREPRRLTRANPQQDGFLWGSAEHVRWRSADGRPLRGILIKPDGFDAARKYPMVIYFYERRSQTLHNHVVPEAGTTPNFAVYASNGYLVFVPDIVYREGYPGESCLACLMPGVLSLVEKGFVDPKGIGISGHSWGGYQVAWLVTRTDLFAAAVAGAPVSNMFSAYGGIRWSTGMSRAFQYEKEQSRIGGTPWEYPLRYLENSPIFFADKVRTPLLMLHNDQDGAVPWYQGIEYFTALRRLGREVYLFNYNGEGHTLGRRANKLDWSERMLEFFDHHLRGKPAPEWMTRGVPFAERELEKARRAQARRI